MTVTLVHFQGEYIYLATSQTVNTCTGCVAVAVCHCDGGRIWCITAGTRAYNTR